MRVFLLEGVEGQRAMCSQVNGELPLYTDKAVIEVTRGNCINTKWHPEHNGEGGKAEGF